jgi:hypothetical protein
MTAPGPSGATGNDDSADPGTDAAGLDAAGPDAGALDAGHVSDQDAAADAGTDGASGEDADAGVACTANAECGAEAFCDRPCGGEGVCEPRPTDCTGEDDPVCGCNGVTYDSACHAHMAGVSVEAGGACEGTCTDNDHCDAAELCLKRTANCDGAGRCAETPACGTPRLGAEVCGCDGNTYDSECYAHAARTTVAHEGPCEVEPCEDPPGDCCFDDGDCGPDLRCVGAICSPRGEMAGTCVTDELEPGECWVDADCARGEICTNAQRCPCGSACLVEDQPGTCQELVISVQ